MATDATEEFPVDAEAEVDEAGSRKRFDFGNKNLKLVALLVVVMGAQTAVIYLVLPPPTSSSGAAGQDGSQQAGSETPDSDETAEVDIGKFSVTNSLAAGTIHIDFEVVAIVPRNQAIAFELDATDKHKYRVRQAVEKVARSSNRDELNDPTLDTMKRNLREEVNKVLKKSYISEVVINNFKMMEQ